MFGYLLRISQVNFLKQIQSFNQARQGNVAMMTGLILVPLILSVGIAIDFFRQSNYNEKLQEATDSAALVGMLNVSLTKGEMQKRAMSAFYSNLPPDSFSQISSIDISRSSNGGIVVNVSATLQATFLKVGGFEEFDLNVMSEAAGSDGRGIEIVLALDETKSMEGSKWTQALAALEQTLTSLSSKSGSNDFYVTLLPFNDRVNIGTHNA